MIYCRNVTTQNETSTLIFSLAPEPDDPQDAVVARQFKDHPDIYRQTARYWTFFFASEQPADKKKQFEAYEGEHLCGDCLFLIINSLHTGHIKKLVEVMHIDRGVALTALSQSNWNIDAAMQSLL